MITNAGFSIATGITLITVECCDCGIVFAMPKEFKKECLKNCGSKGKHFFCPNGHGQHYIGKSFETKFNEMKKSRDEALNCCTELESEIDRKERSIRGYKGKISQMKNRGKEVSQ